MVSVCPPVMEGCATALSTAINQLLYKLFHQHLSSWNWLWVDVSNTDSVLTWYPDIHQCSQWWWKVGCAGTNQTRVRTKSSETSLKNTTRGSCSLWLITPISDEVQESGSSLWFASSWQHRETQCVLLLPALGLTAVTLSLFTERPQSADHAQPIWRRGVRERDLHLTSSLQLCSRVPALIVLLLVCLSISGVTGRLLPRKAPTSHHQFLTLPSSWLWKPKSWWRGCVLSQLIKVQSSLTQNKKPEHCVYTLRGNSMFGRKDKGSNCKQDNKHFQITWWNRCL